MTAGACRTSTPLVERARRVHAGDRLAAQVLRDVRHQPVLADGDDEILGLEQEPIELVAQDPRAPPGQGDRRLHRMQGGIEELLSLARERRILPPRGEEEARLLQRAVARDELFELTRAGHDDDSRRQ